MKKQKKIHNLATTLCFTYPRAMKNAFSLLIASLLLLPSVAEAAPAPQSLGTFGFWKAYQVSDGGQPVCYMSLSAPAPQPTLPPTAKKGTPKPAKRGDVVLMITHRPAEGSRDVVSYAAGTKFKTSTEAKVTAGAKEFSLFTQNDTAWSRDAATDHALTLAIRNAPTLAVSGEASKEFAIGDTINLKGSEQAYKAITQACGLPYEALAKPAAKKADPKKPEAKKPTKPEVKAPAKPAKPAPTTTKKKP